MTVVVCGAKTNTLVRGFVVLEIEDIEEVEDERVPVAFTDENEVD